MATMFSSTEEVWRCTGRDIGAGAPSSASILGGCPPLSRSLRESEMRGMGGPTSVPGVAKWQALSLPRR